MGYKYCVVCKNNLEFEIQTKLKIDLEPTD